MDLEAYLEYLKDLRKKNSGPYSIGYEWIIDVVQEFLARPEGGVLDYYNDIRPLELRLKAKLGSDTPTMIEIAFLEAYLRDEGVLHPRGSYGKEYTGTELQHIDSFLRERRGWRWWIQDVNYLPGHVRHVPTQVYRRVLNRTEVVDRCIKEALDQGYRHEKANYARKGLQEDIKKAFDFYYSSARHGRTVALYCLGNLYLQGRGVTADLIQARALFELAVFRRYREGYDGLTQVFARVPGFRHRARLLYAEALGMRMDDMGVSRPLTTPDSITYRGLEDELRSYAAEESVDTVTSLRAFQYHFSLGMPWQESNLNEAARLYKQAIKEGNLSCIWDLFSCCKTQVEVGLMSPGEFLNLLEDLERSSTITRQDSNLCFAYLHEYGAFFGSIERNFDLAHRRYEAILASDPSNESARMKFAMFDFVKRDKEAVEEELAKLQAITYMPRPLCAIAASYAAALPGERPVLFSATPSTATATATATAATATTAASSSSASRRDSRCVMM